MQRAKRIGIIGTCMFMGGIMTMCGMVFIQNPTPLVHIIMIISGIICFLGVTPSMIPMFVELHVARDHETPKYPNLYKILNIPSSSQKFAMRMTVEYNIAPADMLNLLSALSNKNVYYLRIVAALGVNDRRRNNDYEQCRNAYFALEEIVLSIPNAEIQNEAERLLAELSPTYHKIVKHI